VAKPTLARLHNTLNNDYKNRNTTKSALKNIYMIQNKSSTLTALKYSKKTYKELTIFISLHVEQKSY